LARAKNRCAPAGAAAAGPVQSTPARKNASLSRWLGTKRSSQMASLARASRSGSGGCGNASTPLLWEKEGSIGGNRRFSHNTFI
jgi:hypothetical protein